MQWYTMSSCNQFAHVLGEYEATRGAWVCPRSQGRGREGQFVAVQYREMTVPIERYRNESCEGPQVLCAENIILPALRRTMTLLFRFSATFNS